MEQITITYLLMGLEKSMAFYRYQLKDCIKHGKEHIGRETHSDFFWTSQACYWNDEINHVKRAMNDFKQYRENTYMGL